ncbi:MAG: PH domain-containing protein [Candidatus Micrarchaeota archaeon]
MLNEDKENSELFSDSAKLLTIFNNTLNILPFVIIPLTWPLLIWYSLEYVKKFKFRLEKTHLFVRKGVITDSYTLIPYENIQDIHVSQGYTDRLFNMWNVSVFTTTATARGSEIVPWLTKESAEKFKTALFERIKEAKHVTD